MKTQLIMLPNPIIISDKEIQEGDMVCLSNNTVVRQIGNISPHKDAGSKIIAGIEGLPSIDWNGLEEEFGWVDVEKLANEATNKQMIRILGGEEKEEVLDDIQKRKYYFIKGFKKAQSLSERKFSLEDMEKCFQVATNYGCWLQGGSYDNSDNIDWDDYKKTLQQPKIFDIEMEEATGLRQTSTGRANVPLGWYKPKITNNSIKIIKKL